MVIVNGPELATMVKVNCCCALCPGGGWHESSACTVKLKVPKFVGVPDKMPAVESVTPVGNVPDSTDQVSGNTPPEATNWKL